MTSIEDLVSDPNQHVRAALELNSVDWLPSSAKTETISHLLPMFLQMLKDEFPMSDFISSPSSKLVKQRYRH